MSSFVGHSLAAYSLFSVNRWERPYTSWRAVWLAWLVVLASAPDIDYLVLALASPAHQGRRITHSIALSMALPLFTVGVLYFVKGLRRQRRLLSVCVLLAGVSHLVLDFLVGVTPLPLLWPLDSAAFASPVGILPSGGRIQFSNYYLYRNMFIEVGGGMKAAFKSAWGYQGNNLNLPVVNLEAAIPFYETVMGFQVRSRSDSPHRSAVLGRDDIQIGLAENGGDATQDGCAFEVDSAEATFAELKANGLEKNYLGWTSNNARVLPGRSSTWSRQMGSATGSANGKQVNEQMPVAARTTDNTSLLGHERPSNADINIACWNHAQQFVGRGGVRAKGCVKRMKDEG